MLTWLDYKAMPFTQCVSEVSPVLFPHFGLLSIEWERILSFRLLTRRFDWEVSPYGL